VFGSFLHWLTTLLRALFGRRGGEFGGAGASGPIVTQAAQNEEAILEMIAACEGTAHPDGWRALYGWRPGRSDRLFELRDDHPRIAFHFDGTPIAPGETRVPWKYTTAAGRYQITESTHDRVCKKFGRRNFREDGQRKTALDLIREVGAEEDARAGRLYGVIEKCGGLWASLPSSKSGQPKRDYAFCARAFAAFGGVIAK
jgi:muramidase (phage lysozyme)